MTSSARPSWDEYFMEICAAVARRSTCLRRQVGAVLVAEKRILTTGYNGAPAGLAHCGESGCVRAELGVPAGQRHEICRGLHAEQNALVQGALHGVSVRGATLYCTNEPCLICTKMLLNAGITRVVFRDPYPDPLARGMLAEAGIIVTPKGAVGTNHREEIGT
jgi:dCMP deaminase